MTGSYTREGDVRPLLRDVDDLSSCRGRRRDRALVRRVSASAASSRHSRTFLLYADGYSKEMDINSASPDSVEPMPFHGMTKYPYGPSEHYPNREVAGKYNTRVVSRGY